MLIIRLQTPEDQDFSYTQLGSNAISSEWVHGNWEQAVKLAGGQPVTLLIPTLDVLLTRTILVTSNSRQLRQALPFAGQADAWHGRPPLTRTLAPPATRPPPCSRGSRSGGRKGSRWDRSGGR